MIGKLLSIIISCIGALWLGIAGGWLVWKYERLEPGWPNAKVGFLIFHATIHAPGAGSVTALAGQLASLRAQEAAAGRHAAAVAVAQAAITAAASARQGVVQTQIQWRTRTLLKEITVAIPPAVDMRFPLSVGFVRWHDAAARGVDLSESPAPAGQPDDAASLVKPSDLAAVIGGNYGSCRADAGQLSDLQDWVRKTLAAQ